MSVELPDSPFSPSIDSPYHTPADTPHAVPNNTANAMDSSSEGTASTPDKDDSPVTITAKTLQKMLSDVADLLASRAGGPIEISGDLAFALPGEGTFNLQITCDADEETGDTEIRVAQSTASSSRKRSHGQMSTGNSKRMRTDGDIDMDDEDNQVAIIPTKGPKSKIPDPHEKPLNTIIHKINNLSEQVRWLEECRRIAETHHTSREEVWRTSSASFHDENRRMRETHERWVVAEMGWQRNMLSSIAAVSIPPPNAPKPQNTPNQQSQQTPQNAQPPPREYPWSNQTARVDMTPQGTLATQLIQAAKSNSSAGAKSSAKKKR
ncbi:hypothetical protein BT63DRAFT_313652 [Microthyrium microscopicum]|uniref:Uncharacterized protein n=1 Tax=Microthyrium microscopicum TaxID=703497 RepID=A0A6A6U4T2_9PEZI|nr:hypothetical protein BT63DRAFT_313652 [Microthyrium microscopicum]